MLSLKLKLKKVSCSPECTGSSWYFNKFSGIFSYQTRYTSEKKKSVFENTFLFGSTQPITSQV